MKGGGGCFGLWWRVPGEWWFLQWGFRVFITHAHTRTQARTLRSLRPDKLPHPLLSRSLSLSLSLTC